MTAVGVRYKGAAQSVITEVLRIRQANGGILTERNVVDAASDPASPLHPLFQWDNEIAGDGFRIIQARMLLGRMKVHLIEGETVRILPAFVSVATDDGRVRELTARAVADPGLLGQVLAETRTQLRGLRNRLSAFEEAAPVVEHLDAALDVLPS